MRRGGFVSTGAMTWRPLLALLVAVQGCGGDKEVDAVLPDGYPWRLGDSEKRPPGA